MKNKIRNLIFFLIIVLAFSLRLYQLGAVPSSLDWDEVSNGYNAYSILKTARDEYGKLMPLANRSFDDYKPPLYMYLNVPSIALFGLTAFAVRLPSALAGVLAVVSIFALAKRIFKNNLVALLSMFFLAISPWTVHFSRVGFEANVGMATLLLAFTTLLWALPEESNINRKNLALLFLTAIFMGISLYSYHSVRLLLPALLILTSLIFREKFLLFGKKRITLFFVILILMGSPLLIFNSPGAIASRFESTSQKSTNEDLKKSVNLIGEDSARYQYFGNLIHNRRVVIGISSLEKYVSHFDINYLFNKGDDNSRHHLENHGLLYLLELPFILVGIYFAIKKGSQATSFVGAWLLLAPIAASFGDAFPHALRSFNMVVPLTIFSAIGLNYFVKFYRKIIIIFVVSLVVFVSFFDFLHNYLSHYNLYASDAWQFGYKEAVIKSQQLSNNRKIIIDKSIEQAYIFWLFYTQENPASYQKNGNRTGFSNYYFEKPAGNINGLVFVSSASAFPDNYQLLDTIFFPDGTSAVKVGLVNEK